MEISVPHLGFENSSPTYLAQERPVKCLIAGNYILLAIVFCINGE